MANMGLSSGDLGAHLTSTSTLGIGTGTATATGTTLALDLAGLFEQELLGLSPNVFVSRHEAMQVGGLVGGERWMHHIK